MSGFLAQMLSIAVPVTLQNLLFSSFTLIDTLMIGRLGDAPLAAVGMAGKWTWFLTIVFFGFCSGGSVFIAQYFGADNKRGIWRTFGVLMCGTLLASFVFMLPALLMPGRIVGFFTNDSEVMALGAQYLTIVCLSYPFQAVAKGCGTLLESTRRVNIPFVAAIASVLTNVVFNFLLIFGLCGFPALGVRGAAIATALAAVVNAAVIVGAGLAKKTMLRAPLSALFRFDASFIREYLVVSAPVMLNETTWAMSNLVYSMIFGHMSTAAYAVITVTKSIEDLSGVAMFGLCSSAAVLIGAAIGAGDEKRAKQMARLYALLTIGLSVTVGALVIVLRAPILSLFGVSEAVRQDASTVLGIFAMEMTLRNLPLILVVGIFRAGGDTRFGLIVDCATMLIGIPATACAGLALGLSVPATYLVMYLSEDVIKCVVYLRHMLSGKWIRPVTKQQAPTENLETR